MASLGKDISKIRQEHQLSLDEVYEETRIPVHILKSIEMDTVFDDIDENRTYIRSYIRSYAKFLGIEDEYIIWCLNLAEDGEYNGQLLNPDEHTPDLDTSEEMADPEHPKHPPGSSAASSGKKPKWSYDQTSTPQPSVKSFNWANIGQSFSTFSGSLFVKIGLGIAVLIAGFLVVNYFILPIDSNIQPENNDTNQSQNLLPVDSVETQYITRDTSTAGSDTTAETGSRTGTGSTDTTATTTVTPPDTLDLIIYAAYDKLEPVRVASDIGNSIDPYWLEKGNAMRFAFTDSIKIRGQYSRMILLLNGHPIPDITDEYYDRQKRFIILRREFFTEPKWYAPPPDSIPIDAPQPDTIKTRPIFN